jgi:hypothetical protein
MSSDLRRERTIRLFVEAVAAAGLLLPAAACASAKPRQSDSAPCSALVDYPRADIVTSSGNAKLSSSALAYFAFGYDHVDSRQRRSQGYIIIVRGQPRWYEVGGLTRSGGTAHSSERRVHVWEVAGRQLTTVFDPMARVVELLGTRVGLDTANVIRLDRVDGIGGPPVIRGAACARRIHVNDIAKDLLDGVPGLRGYASANGGA